MTLTLLAGVRPARLSYEEAVAWWYGRINYEQRTPKVSDLKLDRMRELLDRLGNPQERLRVIHVAGSKGKGSCSAMLAAILRHAGYRTGLFTSPHLVRVEERVQVEGIPVHPEELASLLDTVKAAVDEMDFQATGREERHPVTFFEIATAVGLLHFVHRRVDACILEVGLGGRFDSTNVCDPIVSVITSISLDHTQMLGYSLSSIAFEKAGIIKSQRPTVSGVVPSEPRQVIERICRERRSPLCQLDRDFHFSEYKPGRIALDRVLPGRVRISTRKRTWPELEVKLLGEHQAANASVAVACVELLQSFGWHIGDAAVKAGLATVDWPARLEVASRQPLIILDCAHNVASVQALVDSLRASFPDQMESTGNSKRILIFAASSDKDIPGMLRVLAPSFTHIFLTRYTSSARGAPAEQMAECLRLECAVESIVTSSASAAWESVHGLAHPNDLICITGSVFLAGELRSTVLGASFP